MDLEHRIQELKQLVLEIEANTPEEAKILNAVYDGLSVAYKGLEDLSLEKAA